MSRPNPRTRDSAILEANADDVGSGGAARSWGIGQVPWLWATKVRILVMVDGRINAGYGEMDSVWDGSSTRCAARYSLGGFDLMSRSFIEPAMASDSHRMTSTSTALTS